MEVKRGVREGEAEAEAAAAQRGRADARADGVETRVDGGDDGDGGGAVERERRAQRPIPQVERLINRRDVGGAAQRSPCSSAFFGIWPESREVRGL